MQPIKAFDLQPSIVSVETNYISEFQNIFPNPSNEHFSLSGLDISSIINLYITNSNGKIIILNNIDYNTKNNIIEFNLNKLTNRFYYLYIEKANYKH